MEKVKFSKGGVAVEYSGNKLENTPAEIKSNSAKRVISHFERHVGKVISTIPDDAPNMVNIDIHIIEPSTDIPYYTLFTTGMSDLPMNPPTDLPEFKLAELILHLPPFWNLDPDNFDDDTIYWPVRWLRKIARRPHEYNSWLGHTHMVPNDNPDYPFSEGVGFNCWMLMMPLLMEEEFEIMQLGLHKQINFYTIFPLYDEEVQYSLDNGIEALFNKLNKNNMKPVLQIGRKNTCKRPWWKIF